MFPIPYVVGHAIALPDAESAGLLITANTSFFHSLPVVFALITSWAALFVITSIPIDWKKHRFDLLLGANIRYKPRPKSFLFALDAAKTFRRA